MQRTAAVWWKSRSAGSEPRGSGGSVGDGARSGHRGSTWPSTGTCLIRFSLECLATAAVLTLGRRACVQQSHLHLLFREYCITL